MNSNRIGVFDSGVGGLTALKEINRLLPYENKAYIGDNANAPYSGNTEGELLRIARQNVDLLLRKEVKAILIACGTLSSTVLPFLQNEYSLPILGVIEPTAVRAACSTKTGKVLVFSTVTTARSHAFSKAIDKIDKHIQCQEIGCFKLAPMIERGIISRNNIELKNAIKEYAGPVKEWGADTIILGCTHYPVVAESFTDFLGDVNIVEAGKEGAIAFKELLVEKDLLSDSMCLGKSDIFFTGAAETFEATGKYLLGETFSASKII